MLTRLRFKNWRSLKDVTIDNLTPLTVFIGANSSGKTNILEGLRFYRDYHRVGILQTLNAFGYRRIQTIPFADDDELQLEYTFQQAELSPNPITEKFQILFDGRDIPFKFAPNLKEGDTWLTENPLREFPEKAVFWQAKPKHDLHELKRNVREREINSELYPQIRNRWQMLGENLAPRSRLSFQAYGDLYVLEPDASNMPIILNWMQTAHPDVFESLSEDLRWLLGHVEQIILEVNPQTRDMELQVFETNRIARSISAGTMRLIAMLTAVYALDMPQQEELLRETKPLTPSAPGLIAIEEPDTALNPGLLKKFVGLLRNYVDTNSNGGKPRQFIMTTHNPAFLDFFKPEEVRVVERGEDGFTTVKPIPERVEEIWLKEGEYGLGEVWTTNSFGGLPE